VTPQRELFFPEDEPDPEPESVATFSVSELTAAIAGVLERSFGEVRVEGEISNLARPRSGHVYLTLKDDNSQLRAVIYRNVASRLPFKLEDGLAVVATGAVTVYRARGEYQLTISSLEPQGIGALELAFRQRVAELRAEGLFEPGLKKRLPFCPRRVGFVTSPTGAAVRDFLQVLKRRFPGTDVLVLPCRVQGNGAAEEIAGAIMMANAHAAELGLEVLAVGRGGGSLEDLWAFNEEIVARAIFASRLPVVSCVGHEVDITIADLVADVRAATPSEAAELIVPSREDIAALLNDRRERLTAALRARVERCRSRLAQLSASSALRRPLERVERYRERLAVLTRHLNAAMQRQIDRSGAMLGQFAASLEGLSPLAVLRRGYSLTQTEQGDLVRNSAGLSVGDRIVTRLEHGRVISRVEQIEPSKQEGPA
jgi:exodeoxyribonuclease VII large subunit